MQRWSDFAATEIESWPGTADVGMTDRVAELIRRLDQPGSIIDGD
jgi:hypothetical protein